VSLLLLFQSPAGEAGVTGSASITLAGLGLTAAGKAPVAGASAVTLGAATLASAGAIPVTGALGKGLADVTLAGAGAVAVKGATLATLAGVAVTGAGVQSGPVGAFSRTLDGLALQADGMILQPITGAAAITLADCSLTGAGKVAVSGALACSLGATALLAEGIYRTYVTGLGARVAYKSGGRATVAAYSRQHIDSNERDTEEANPRQHIDADER
jgi:hypothetical protein